MREIKFRVWDKLNKKWVNPDLYCLAIDNGNVGTWDDGVYRAEDFEVQQFTGLQDKKLNDVYEGDIVKYNLGDKSVKWIDLVVFDHYAWRLAHYDGLESGCTNLFPYPDLEVIGNIFENPELLK